MAQGAPWAFEIPIRGIGLGSPGLSEEGPTLAVVKRWLGLGSLGTYMESRGVGTLTTESSWDSENFNQRSLSHVLAVRAVLDSKLPDTPPPKSP